MGLDVWCYKVKDKEAWRKSVAAKEEFEKYSNELLDRYSEEATAACKKWNRWYNDLIEKVDQNIITDEEYNTEIEKDPYKYTVTDFATSDEKLKYQLLKNDLNIALYEPEEIKDLYMRKQYWFIQYCYHKYDQYMIKEERFSSRVLDNENHYYDMVLNKDDVADIISRLTKIVDNCNELMNNEDVKNFITSLNLKQIDYDSVIESTDLKICSKLAVNLEGEDKHLVGLVNTDYVDSIFPIYEEYVHSYRPAWNYSVESFKYYLDKWKDVYKDLTENELIWVHEWW